MSDAAGEAMGNAVQMAFDREIGRIMGSVIDRVVAFHPAYGYYSVTEILFNSKTGMFEYGGETVMELPKLEPLKIEKP